MESSDPSPWVPDGSASVGAEPVFQAIGQGAKEIYYPGAPDGLTATLQDQVNADLLAVVRS